MPIKALQKQNFKRNFTFNMQLAEMKLLMDLYKEMTLETHKQGKAVSEYHLPPHKRAKLLHPSCKPVDKAVQGSKPSYYGVTKESFRSSHK
ncbi:hypothetical protein FEM48_Zijuj03G0155500 [Ziziphus jujuba var. spinosa]|uniref:Uncharacterized protein n=1 Tax=Ziziphus jujuba var. spinosa TaxID=714518 RepID=A0A978VR49_ZIZJJ|nr:hypothetical protein FEM48_Zijuj03G0155500 [Ziziphus jujuba var. spinosa]